MMKIGSMVKIPGSRRRLVVLKVTKRGIKRGMNARRPGLYMFTGMWYGKNPNDHKSFGKILTPYGRVVGNVRDIRHLTGARRHKFT
jgi:hypothetical protein